MARNLELENKQNGQIRKWKRLKRGGLRLGRLDSKKYILSTRQNWTMHNQQL